MCLSEDSRRYFGIVSPIFPFKNIFHCLIAPERHSTDSNIKLKKYPEQFFVTSRKQGLNQDNLTQIRAISYSSGHNSLPIPSPVVPVPRLRANFKSCHFAMSHVMHMVFTLFSFHFIYFGVNFIYGTPCHVGYC